jgi:hypothetical protein
MAFMSTGAGHGAAVGVGVDRRDLVVPGRGLQGEIAGGVQRLVRNLQRPRPKPGH